MQTDFICSAKESVSPIEFQLKNISFLATQLCSSPISLITLFESPDCYWYTAPSDEKNAAFIKQIVDSINEYPNRNDLIERGLIGEQKINSIQLFGNLPCIQFYTGISLLSSSNKVIGHLWIFDSQKREDASNFFSSLSILADQASKLIEMNELILASKVKKPFEQTEELNSQSEIINALIKSETYLKRIIENSGTGYSLLDANYNTLAFNSVIEEYALNDLHVKLMIGQNALTVFPENRKAHLAEVMSKVLKGESISYEIKYLQPDNTYRWYLVKFIPVKNNLDQELGLVMSMDNITNQKMIESELDKSVQTLTEQNKRLLNFSYIVSHNLRSHTSNIKSILRFLKEAKTEKERIEFLGYLASASDSLNDTMDNLNEILSIHNTIDQKLEKIDLNKSVRKTIEVLREQIEDSSAIVHNKVSPNTMINYNPAYLESILFNFLSNAIKYRSPNRQAIIFIDTITENVQTVIRISDNGMGIDLEKNGSKLFGMYKTFHGKKDARGIGLFITKNQVEAMNGKIEVESTINEGTIFKIFI